MAQTMFEKIWDRHVIVTRGGNECLLSIDRNFVHEGSFHAFGRSEEHTSELQSH